MTVTTDRHKIPKCVGIRHRYIMLDEPPEGNDVMNIKASARF